MFGKTTINKAQFQAVLSQTINGNPHFYLKYKKNRQWLKSRNIRDKNMSLWFERNERTFTIPITSEKVDKSADIAHFVSVANNVLRVL